MMLRQGHRSRVIPRNGPPNLAPDFVTVWGWRGQQIRNRKTGKLYLVGEHWNKVDFWLMRFDPAGKGHYPASDIVRDFLSPEQLEQTSRENQCK